MRGTSREVETWYRKGKKLVKGMLASNPIGSALGDSVEQVRIFPTRGLGSWGIYPPTTSYLSLILDFQTLVFLASPLHKLHLIPQAGKKSSGVEFQMFTASSLGCREVNAKTIQAEHQQCV